MTLWRQAARFGSVGVLNTAVGLAAIYVAMLLGAAPAAANLAGYAVGLALGFVLNRSWTFASHEPARVLLPRYLAAVALSYLLNLLVVLSAISHFGIHAFLAQPLGIGVYTVTLFLISRRLVFRPAARAT